MAIDLDRVSFEREVSTPRSRLRLGHEKRNVLAVRRPEEFGDVARHASQRLRFTTVEREQPELTEPLRFISGPCFHARYFELKRRARSIREKCDTSIVRRPASTAGRSFRCND